MKDIFIPTSSAEGRLTGPLHTVTWITGDKDGLETAMTTGYGLTCSGWSQPSGTDKAALDAYFGFSSDMDWQMAAFQKDGTGSNVQLRAFYVPDNVDPVRSEHAGLYLGGATISFPINDLRAHERHMAGIGVDTTIGVKEMEFTSPEGETYISAEIAYLGPDNIFMLGVTRPSVFVPVGPVDPATGLGGMAYSARCSADTSAVLAMLTDVLGWEIRRDIEMSVGPKSAINMPEGTVERFIQAFAPGSDTGYLVLMDHGEATLRSSVPLGPPQRGIVMWSLPTRDLDSVYERAQKAGVTVRSAPGAAPSPFLPSGPTMLLEDADGFVMEVFEA